ncbi:hypothetical protein ACHAPT_008594 [Fusarium lateritium]
MNRDPIFRSRTASDYRIEVGIISTFLFNKRMRQLGRDNAERAIIASQEGQPAYLGLALNPGEESFSWFHEDKRGKAISPALVDYTLFEDKASAYRACMESYDSREVERVEGYNRNYLIALARRRVVHFSETGTRTVPEIRPEDRPTKMETVLLASPFLPRMNAFL